MSLLDPFQWHWDIWKTGISCFIEYSPYRVFLFPREKIQIMHLVRKLHTWYCVLLRMSHQEYYPLLAGWVLITGWGIFCFLHCIVTMLSLSDINSKAYGWRHFGIMQISCSSSNSPNLVYIYYLLLWYEVDFFFFWYVNLVFCNLAKSLSSYRFLL